MILLKNPIILSVHPCDHTKEHCPHPPPHNDSGSGANANVNANAGSTSATEDYTAQKANVTPGSAPFVAIVAAAAAAIAAMAALAVAAKRRRKPSYHQLRGSVKARMNLFSGFANRCFEDRAASGLQNAASQDGLQVV